MRESKLEKDRVGQRERGSVLGSRGYTERDKLG